MFNRTRLTLARKRRGLTKKSLAQLVGLDSRSITGFEAGEFAPSGETLQLLAKQLDFPVEFFAGDDLEEPRPEGASFRSMSRITASQRNAALSAGALAFLISDYVDARFDLPAPDLLDLRDETPTAAVEYLRQHWGIGERPIKNMIHLLEAKGVRVFSLTENFREVDAYSLWKDGRPFIFLNTMKSAEHSRFDAAHELAHLVLHRHGELGGPFAEKQTNEFAAAFLMPKARVRAASPIVPTINHLIDLKKIWGVSVTALAVRLHRLGLLSQWHYECLCIEIQRRGFRLNEPDPAPRETSQVWGKVFTSLKEDGITKSQLAKDLAISTREIEMLVFGLTLIGITSSKGPLFLSPPRRGHLHLIE